MKRWKYKVVQFNATGLFGGIIDNRSIEEKLNEFGQLGWEIVSGYATTQDLGSTRKVVYTLKKDITDEE